MQLHNHIKMALVSGVIRQLLLLCGLLLSNVLAMDTVDPSSKVDDKWAVVVFAAPDEVFSRGTVDSLLLMLRDELGVPLAHTILMTNHSDDEIFRPPKPFYWSLFDTPRSAIPAA